MIMFSSSPFTDINQSVTPEGDRGVSVIVSCQCILFESVEARKTNRQNRSNIVVTPLEQLEVVVENF